MKGNFKTLVLIFSIALNIVFIGSSAYYKLSSNAAASRPSPGCPFLYQELNLSKEQLHQIEPIRDRFHARLNEIGSEIKTKQLELITLLERLEPDRKAVNGLQERIRTLQQAMQESIISHIEEETRIFTPEQRANFFKLMKERMEQVNQSCPPWMRPSEGKK